MSFNREMDKQSMLYLYNKIFQRYREISNKIMEKSKCNLPREGSQSDKATWSFYYMTFWKGTPMETIKRFMTDILGIGKKDEYEK